MSRGDCEYPVKDKPHISSARREADLVPQYDPSRLTTVYSKSDDKLTQLVEYQEMVEMAENKCTRLKNKLERLKEIYTQQNELLIENQSPEQVRQTQSVQIGGPTCNQMLNQKIDILDNIAHKESPGVIKVDVSVPLHLNKMRHNMVRQSSKQISTDASGAALGTISNILTGISQTFGSSDHGAMAPKRTIRQAHEAIETRQKTTLNEMLSEMHGVETVKLNSKTKRGEIQEAGGTENKGRSYEKDPRIKEGKQKKLKRTSSKFSQKNASQMTIKSKSHKKLRKICKSDILVGRDRSVPFLTKQIKRSFKRPKPKTEAVVKPYKEFSSKDLVEIYHNSAIKECNSSEIHLPKKIKTQRPLITVVPPLNLKETDLKLDEPKIYDPPGERNYELPTVASALKKVAKFYIERYVRNIPFCPVKSLGPSHNIGIKIQQALNMLKTRQPPENISLAYNIGLAAERLNNKNLSSLASSLTSKIRQPLNEECPLARNINYQRLKELAKAIPEESVEEVNRAEEDEVKPEGSVPSLVITGPSGDMIVQNPKRPVWTGSGDNKSCICGLKDGVDFQQISNKYKLRSSNNSITSARPVLVKNKFKLNRPPIPSNRIPSKEISRNSIANKTSSKEVSKSVISPTAGNEQKLKQVLQKLHDEFFTINKRNDFLIEKVNKGDADEELLKEIHSLEKELSSKEEEIGMVVNLYKEVMALKNQMKNLKEKTSKEIVNKKNQKFKSNTATHLTKLLRQIQHYQAHYKKIN